MGNSVFFYRELGNFSSKSSWPKVLSSQVTFTSQIKSLIHGDTRKPTTREKKQIRRQINYVVIGFFLKRFRAMCPARLTFLYFIIIVIFEGEHKF